MAMMEISVLPVGTGSPSLSTYVAAVVRVVQEAGLEHELGAMGTVVVGPVEQLLDLARRMHEVPFALGAVRVATTIKLDDRRDKALTIAGKVRAVQERLRE